MSRSETTLRIADEAPTRRLGSRPDGQLALGRYRLEERIGAGGFGVVWRAHDERLQRDVAVKVVPADRDDPESARVEREALAAARLNHPGIVALYELGHDEHDAFLVSELVDGATLGELEREGAVSDRDVARIGTALCEALEHAHDRGVVHRDIKPGNVMVVAEPAAGAGFAKLTDFGIAHLASAETLTATGDVVGTLAYMSPEQAEGSPATAATDVYALALTLYEAWTGSNPVRADNAAATARRVGQPLPPLRSRRPELPAPLCEAIDAALDPDPVYRPGLAELREVMREAEGDLDEGGGLVEPETIERFGLTAVQPRTGLTAILRDPGPLDRGSPATWSPAGRILSRALAGGLAGLLVLAALESLAPESSVSSLTAAGVAALAVALLPRVGWIAAVLALGVLLASPEVGQEGTALVLTAALLSVPFLLPRAGLLWSVPILAPLLGTIALAPMFVGVAALAGTIWRRAGLAAAGALWLAFAEVLTGDTLLFGAPLDAAQRSAWEGSVVDAARDALAPLASSAVLVPALTWAAFAVLLPIAVWGRSLRLDLAGAALWVVGYLVALDAAGDAVAGVAATSSPRGAIVGAVLAAGIFLAARRVAPPAERDDTEAALP